MVWITQHHTSVDFNVPSQSRDKDYIVSWGDNQYMDSVQEANPQHSGKYDWSCTCKDWKYHRVGKGGYCKHILEVIDRRVLWSTEDEEDVIAAVDLFELNRLAGLVKKGKDTADTDILFSLAKRIVDSTMYYAPIFGADGSPVPLIKVTEKEYREILENGNDIMVGGELTSNQFGMLVDYILDPSSDNERRNMQTCVVEGHFYPDADYLLSSEEADMQTRCSACGAASIELSHKGGHGHVCPNASCEKSVNHPVNIQNRRHAIAEKKNGA